MGPRDPCVWASEIIHIPTDSLFRNFIIFSSEFSKNSVTDRFSNVNNVNNNNNNDNNNVI